MSHKVLKNNEFDDASVRRTRGSKNQYWQNVLITGSFMTADEQLVAFQGHLPVSSLHRSSRLVQY